MSSKLPGTLALIAGVIVFAAFLGTLLGAASQVVCVHCMRPQVGKTRRAPHRGDGGVRNHRDDPHGGNVFRAQPGRDRPVRRACGFIVDALVNIATS